MASKLYREDGMELLTKCCYYNSHTSNVCFHWFDSLGAYPDGREGTNGNDCPGDGPHIMGYWNDLDFTFSKCTVKYFKRNLLGIRDG